MGRYRYPHHGVYWKAYHQSKRARISMIYGGFDSDVLAAFYQISQRQLEWLLSHYRQEYGSSSATYARRTYTKWKAGEVQPSGQTVERLLVMLPRVLDFQVKCDLLRKLRERHRKRESINLTVDPLNWMEAITPTVMRIVSKAYQAELPQMVESRLTWLSDRDMQAARVILTAAEVQEGKTAISLLREEFKAINDLLVSLPGKRKITHTIELPYGAIKLIIKRSRLMSNDNQNAPKNQSLFRPTADDILDSALQNLDQQQVKEISSAAAKEAVNIAAERKRAELRTEHAKQGMNDFIENADTLNRRGQDYRMRGEFDSASGKTTVEVSRQKSASAIVIAIVIGVILLLLYLSKH